MKLDRLFFAQEDVTKVAQALLGKVLYSNSDGIITAGRIVETEAYSYKEKACHAHMMKKTKRTEVLFESPGTAYVYLCYGIHKLFNIVTNKKGIAEAVLIRALEPVSGEEEMFKRREVKSRLNLCSGPGKLSEALNIDLSFNRKSVFNNSIWIEDHGIIPNKIESSPRIGVAYAEEDAHLPWRYIIAENKYISKGSNNYK